MLRTRMKLLQFKDFHVEFLGMDRHPLENALKGFGLFLGSQGPKSSSKVPERTLQEFDIVIPDGRLIDPPLELTILPFECLSVALKALISASNLPIESLPWPNARTYRMLCCSISSRRFLICVASFSSGSAFRFRSPFSSSTDIFKYASF